MHTHFFSKAIALYFGGGFFPSWCNFSIVLKNRNLSFVYALNLTVLKSQYMAKF